MWPKLQACGAASHIACNRTKPQPSTFSQAKATIVKWPVFEQYISYFTVVSELVDRSCRNGSDTLIMCVHTKAFLTSRCSCSLQASLSTKQHYSSVFLPNDTPPRIKIASLSFTSEYDPRKWNLSKLCKCAVMHVRKPQWRKCKILCQEN